MKNTIKNTKKWFTLVEIMIAVSIIWILWMFMLILFQNINIQKHQVSVSWYFNTMISNLDRELHLSLSNADKIIYPWVDNDFCEWMSWWTVNTNWWTTSASINDQNLDKKWNTENWVEQPWYTMSDVSHEWIMFCDENWKINFIWLAKKYIPKKWTEHNVLVHYVNRRVKELTPTDNVSSEVRENWSIPTSDKEHLEFITPMNIWILKLWIDYPFNNMIWTNRALKWTVAQKTMTNVDIQILFEYSWLTWWKQTRTLYRYFKNVNLKNTID